MGKHYEENKYKLLGIKLLHIIVSIIIFYLFWLLFRYNGIHGMDKYGFRYNYFVAIEYGILLYWFDRTYDSFLFGYTRIRSLLFRQFLSQLFSIITVYMSVSIAWNNFRNPSVFFLMLIIQMIFNTIWSCLGTLYYFRLIPLRKTLLIYRNNLDKKRFGSIKGKPTERLYKIIDELQYDGSFANLKEKLQGYEAIFVAGVNSKCRNGILKYCKENSIPGFFLPHVGDTIMQEAIHVKAFDSPVLYVNRTIPKPEYAIIKRIFDIITSGTALIILSPIMLITALAIHFYDGGPALYRQIRLTKSGKKFNILKFRSMRVDAEKDGVARLSSGKHDDRITPVGKMIRKCRLDELPQLWNIFVGEMSVVGPRPERPEIAEQYYEKMPDFQLRLQVKAGLTGYAQVYGKYNTDPYEKLEFDLMYIKNMNFLTDIELCFATFAILFLSKSTEGIAANATTAMNYENSADSTEDEVKMAAK